METQAENETLTRGQLAKRSGKTFEAIRFYEKKGLIRPAFRDSSNYRRYRPSDSQRLAFIDQAKEFGFTLSEIAEVLDLNDRDAEACRTMGEMAVQRIAEIEAEIAKLQRQRSLLRRLEACKALGGMDCDCDVVAQANRLSKGCDCCE